MLLLPIDTAPSIGTLYWKSFVEPYRQAFEEVLHHAHRNQALRVHDPELAASHFFSLVMGDPTLRYLLNAQRPMSAEARAVHVGTAVACFVTCYCASEAR